MFIWAHMLQKCMHILVGNSIKIHYGQKVRSSRGISSGNVLRQNDREMLKSSYTVIKVTQIQIVHGNSKTYKVYSGIQGV